GRWSVATGTTASWSTLSTPGRWCPRTSSGPWRTVPARPPRSSLDISATRVRLCTRAPSTGSSSRATTSPARRTSPLARCTRRRSHLHHLPDLLDLQAEGGLCFGRRADAAGAVDVGDFFLGRAQKGPARQLAALGVAGDHLGRQPGAVLDELHLRRHHLEGVD